MALITCFEELPDLCIFEIFRYLCSLDILWSFMNLNDPIEQLLHERGFFRRINLSSAYFYQFNKLLNLLALDEVQTLVIDIEASPLQIPRFSYFPQLTILKIYALCDFEDASNFIVRHSRTLKHLTLIENESLRPWGFAGYVSYPQVRLSKLLERTLPHLNALQSLDLGQTIGVGLPLWQPTTRECPLTYLRLPLQNIQKLCQLMSLEKLSTTLEELHVAIRSLDSGVRNTFPGQLVLSKMVNLHTFNFVQSMFSSNKIGWLSVEVLTDPNVMPSLRHMKLILFIYPDDLHAINESALFTDHRRVDVQFAFIMDYDISDTPWMKHLPHGSRFQPRQIVGVRCSRNSLTAENRQLTNLDTYFDRNSRIHYVWYTLPWISDEFFALEEPYSYITKVETLVPSQCNSSIRYSSQLRTLSISQNNSPPSIISMPHVVQLDRINTVHLSYHDWPIGLNLSNIRRIVLTNNIMALKDFSVFPSNIRSILISLDAALPNFICHDWSVLRSLSSLPKLTLLQIIIQDLDTKLDDNSCQVIAETAPLCVHFGIYFRRSVGMDDPNDINNLDEMNPGALALLPANPNMIVAEEFDPDNPPESFLIERFNECQISIKEICHRISNLSLHTEPLIVIEKEYCGLTVWF